MSNIADDGNSTVAITLDDANEQQSSVPANVCTPEEANTLLTDLCRAHTQRQEVRTESARLDKDMKAYKKELIRFMRAYNTDRLRHEEEGKCFLSRYKEKNRGAKMADLLQMIERDAGLGKRQEYERELETLSKQKVRVQDNRITYIGLRKAGERNPGAAPPRKRAKPST